MVWHESLWDGRESLKLQRVQGEEGAVCVQACRQRQVAGRQGMCKARGGGRWILSPSRPTHGGVSGGGVPSPSAQHAPAHYPCPPLSLSSKMQKCKCHNNACLPHGMNAMKVCEVRRKEIERRRRKGDGVSCHQTIIGITMGGRKLASGAMSPPPGLLPPVPRGEQAVHVLREWEEKCVCAWQQASCRTDAGRWCRRGENEPLPSSLFSFSKAGEGKSNVLLPGRQACMAVAGRQWWQAGR